ncbi:three-helix bundle dimerization domain-containing protein [Mycobacterium sp. NPDC003449]
MLGRSETELIADVEHRLVARFAAVPPERVASAVATARLRFHDSVIRDFVPLLVERRVASELANA